MSSSYLNRKQYISGETQGQPHSEMKILLGTEVLIRYSEDSQLCGAALIASNWQKIIMCALSPTLKIIQVCSLRKPLQIFWY